MMIFVLSDFESNGVMSGDRFGISLEAGFQRRLTPRLDFYVGLSYYRQKQTLTYEYNGSGVTVDQGGKNGEYSITPMKESKSFQYNMTNAGISSGVMYHLCGDKLMHKIGGGFQFQKGLDADGVGKFLQQCGINLFQLSIVVSIGSPVE